MYFRILINILIISSASVPQVLGDNNFKISGGAEFGPNFVSFESLPKSFLPSGRNSTTGSILSFWFRLGVKYNNVHLLGRFALTGSSGIGLEESDSINMGNLLLTSCVATTKLFRYKRLSMDGLIGYQYSAFDTYTSENRDIIFEINDWGPVVGVSPKFLLKKSSPDIAKEREDNFEDRFSLDFGYEYAFVKHQINRFFVSFRSTDDNSYILYRFRYIHQKNVCKIYVLTIGWYGAFGF